MAKQGGGEGKGKKAVRKKKKKQLKGSRHIGLGRKMKKGQRYQSSKYTE